MENIALRPVICGANKHVVFIYSGSGQQVWLYVTLLSITNRILEESKYWELLTVCYTERWYRSDKYMYVDHNGMVYTCFSLLTPPYLPIICGHIREMAFGETEK